MTRTAPPLHDRIALRAYYAWEAAGRIHGEHEAHWLAAEQVERDLAARAEAEAIAAGIEAAKAKRSAAARKAAANRRANCELAGATMAQAVITARPTRLPHPTAH